MDNFKNNEIKVNSIVTLSLFPYISGKDYSRLAMWQKSHKTSIDFQLTPSSITRLAQSITDNDRMNLIKCRLLRQTKCGIDDCDSTSRSGWGKCLVDIKWGKNKCNPELRYTIDVVVYSLSTYEPIYYRLFHGNIADVSTIRTILSELAALKIKDIILSTHRGYLSEENIAAFVGMKLPFLICAKVDTKPVSELLLKIDYSKNGYPANMEFNSEKRLFFTQLIVEPYMSKLADGTDIEVKGLKVNLFLDLYKRMDEISDIYCKINEEKDTLEKDIRERNIPKDIKKYNASFDYFKVNETVNEDKGITGFTYTECSNKIEREISKCGFFALLSHNLNMNCEEILDHYKRKDEHGKKLSELKSYLNFNIQKSSSEESKNGKSFFDFIGLICISKLRNAWKKSFQNVYHSTLEMLDEMESIRFSEYTDGSTRMTTFTMKQVEICNVCGIEVPYECMPQSLRAYP